MILEVFLNSRIEKLPGFKAYVETDHQDQVCTRYSFHEIGLHQDERGRFVFVTDTAHCQRPIPVFFLELVEEAYVYDLWPRFPVHQLGSYQYEGVEATLTQATPASPYYLEMHCTNTDAIGYLFVLYTKIASGLIAPTRSLAMHKKENR